LNQNDAGDPSMIPYLAVILSDSQGSPNSAGIPGKIN